jgi:ATP-binding cassette, subfamily C (CFTR/MRP), member 4
VTVNADNSAANLFSFQILAMSKSVQTDGIQGRVINLLSNDFSKFEDALSYFPDLWKAPFETLLVGYLIFIEIGMCGLIGVVFILSLMPIQCEKFPSYGRDN